MLAKELLAKVGKEPLPGVLLFCPGTASFNKEPWEPLLAERCVDAVVNHYVDPSLRDLALTVFYADEAAPGQIVVEAQTMPFLAERRVIVVRNAERYFGMSGEKGSPLSALLEYFKSPSDFSLMLFVSNKADKRLKFYTGCKSAGEVVECPQLTDGELGAWVREEAQRMGKRVEAEAVEELIERAGGRLSDVSNALTILSNYIGAADVVRVEDVRAACADVAEETVWMLTDAIAQSNSGRALHLLHQLFDLGKSPDEIIGTINWLLVNAYQAAPETPHKVRSSYVERKVAPLAEKWGVQKLITAMALCTETLFKTRETGADRELLVELLVSKLAYPLPKKRAAARR